MARVQYVLALCLSATCLVIVMATSADAQQAPQRLSAENSFLLGPSIGEDYTVEITGSLWDPSPLFVASSEQFGIIGSNINFGSDLGLVRKRHRAYRLTLKTGRRHKLHVSRMLMQYRQNTVLKRRLVFQGIAWDVGLPVSSLFKWDAWRFGYEFDVVIRERGYFGLILEAKHTQLEARLESESAYEFTRAQVPIPALGTITRIYLTRFIPLTVEFTAFKLPSNLADGHEVRHVDFDIYGTLNFSRMVGLNIGYRSLDFSFLVDRDTGDLELNGIYVSGVFRF